MSRRGPHRPAAPPARPQSGLSGPKAAAQLGVTASTVAKWVRRAGVPARPPGLRLPAEDGEILRLRGQGLLWREVAAEVGMSKDGVVSWQYAPIHNVHASAWTALVVTTPFGDALAMSWVGAERLIRLHDPAPADGRT